MFPLFLGMVMYVHEVETKGKQKLTVTTFNTKKKLGSFKMFHYFIFHKLQSYYQISTRNGNGSPFFVIGFCGLWFAGFVISLCVAGSLLLTFRFTSDNTVVFDSISLKPIKKILTQGAYLY